MDNLWSGASAKHTERPKKKIGVALEKGATILTGKNSGYGFFQRTLFAVIAKLPDSSNQRAKYITFIRYEMPQAEGLTRPTA